MTQYRKHKFQTWLPERPTKPIEDNMCKECKRHPAEVDGYCKECREYFESENKLNFPRLLADREKEIEK